MGHTRTGQYQMEFNIEGFTAPNRAHALRFYTQPIAAPAVGVAMADIDLKTLSGGSIDALVAANAFWAFIRPMFNNSISCSSVSLWRYDTHNSRSFISQAPLTNPLCTGGAPQPMQQVTLTFRAAAGAILKLVLLETNQSGNATVPLVANAAGNVFQQLAAHIMSANGVATAIDNSFPVAPLRDSRGQNEHLFEELNR